ncbi:hypothetical protein Sjap_006624 [Stephania japonica]|uniref:Phenazine biosynthesis PhzC/PhzF protein n=1 Tax=Stephania japonica TaxID=461633 RepID=A0AAP0K6B7_9MAGN
MANQPVKYYVVDAFADAAFKGNPAAVCLLGDDVERDEEWLKAVAREFNLSETCYLTRIADSGESANLGFAFDGSLPLKRLVYLCGHATLASAHVLFTSGLVEGNTIEFLTLSGILTAKRIPGIKEEEFSIELDFPAIEVLECDPLEFPSIPVTLNGAPMIGVKKMGRSGDIIVELSSGEVVANLQPQFEEIEKCSARGVIVTGIAPSGSGFDFFSRFFCPKLKINEDPVCGSAHCALVPYWSKKLGKKNFTAYMASPRGGVLDLDLDEGNNRVRIRGRAITVMEGSLLA